MVLSRMGAGYTGLQRSLAAILLVSVVVISLCFLFTSHSTHLQRFAVDQPFGIDFDFDFDEVVKSIPDWVASKSKPMQNVPVEAPLGAHTRTPDGLLVVNPDAPHPIFELIRDAEAAWEAKCARGSTTLDEAVVEYKRRYGRRPPLGFDKWWEYAVEHDVQLPDEFDEIFEDIQPFWGMDPTELARTREELENGPVVTTFEKVDGRPQLEVAYSTIPPGQWTGLHDRLRDIRALLRDVEQDLTPLRFTICPGDNPAMLSDWRIMSMAREAAANGTTLTGADLPAVTERGWLQACPPDSPARLNQAISVSPTDPPPLPPTLPKTFIASHREAMDPCFHPWLFSTHGQFLADPSGPSPQRTLMPRFSPCSTMVHHDIRLPLPYGWNFGAPEYEDGAFKGDLPWEDKDEKRLDWRGSTTGMHAYPNSFWRHAQRQRLVTLTNAREGNVSVLDVPENEEVPVGDPRTRPLARVNPDWMDIGFAGEPFKCNEGTTCDEMKELWEFHDKQGSDEEGRYKFILDIDGNAWSGRFKRLITSNALIFKTTIYPEWFMSRIAPWVHYVPIQLSYVDMYDTVAFFRVQDELGAKIAKAGREWGRRFWREEDMTAYLYRLLLEYARVSSSDRASMDYMG